MKRFLVVNPFGIGDVLFTMTLVEALRGAHADAFIGFLCNERTAPLVRMNPSIDRTFVFHRDRFRRLWRKHPYFFYRKLKALLGLIREERFDVLFDLSLGREYGFFGAWAGIKKRIGLDYKRRGIFLTHRIRIPGYDGRPAAEYQLDLLPLAGEARPPFPPRPDLRVPAVMKEMLEECFRRNKISPGEWMLAVAPGGGRSWGENARFKQWNAERFAQVSNRLLTTRPHAVCLLGDRGEEALLREVQRRLEARSMILAGEPLPLVAALLSRSSLVLCNDGGLLHLADALGVRTVSLFGPVDERVYGPIHREKPSAVLTAAVPCRPCYRAFHFPPCPYDRRCLTELAADDVLQAVKEIA